MRRRDIAGDSARSRREWPEKVSDETAEEDEALFDARRDDPDARDGGRRDGGGDSDAPAPRDGAASSSDRAPERRTGRPDAIRTEDDRQPPVSGRRRPPEPEERDRSFPLRRRPKPAAQERERDLGARRRRPDAFDDYDEPGRFDDENDDVLFAAEPDDEPAAARPDKPKTGLRFSDDDACDEEKPSGRRRDEPRRPDRRRDAVVDADWEDIDDDGDRSDQDGRDRRRDRRIRAERRRSTALARADEFAALDPRILDEEFFTSLRVQPKELNKALRKARRRAEMREKNRLTPLRALGWTLWIGAVAATAFGVYVYRNEIVRTWPNAAGAYAVIGIEANPYGLAIEDVRHRLAMSTAGPTIEITGKLRNARDAAVKPPLLQAEALGPRGELLSRWTFEAEGDEVLAGEAIEFITRAPAPEGVAEVALSFAPEKGGVISVGDFLTRR
ncbi:MAG: hypothetical protein ACE5FO_00195 [Parvularculaceae bacterium]